MSAFLSPRMCAAAIAPLLAVSGALLTAAPAQATSASVVISEVYGGGGNSGSIWTNDFVELYNRSDAAVDVTGWVVQYYSAAGTSPASGTATLTSSVPPKHTYLVQMAAQGGGTTPLPTPDATGTAAMSGTNGRVDLRLADTTTVVDRVGYGTATTFEGSPRPGPQQHDLGHAKRPLRRHGQQRDGLPRDRPDAGEQHGRHSRVCCPTAGR